VTILSIMTVIILFFDFYRNIYTVRHLELKNNIFWLYVMVKYLFSKRILNNFKT